MFLSLIIKYIIIYVVYMLFFKSPHSSYHKHNKLISTMPSTVFHTKISPKRLLNTRQSSDLLSTKQIQSGKVEFSTSFWIYDCQKCSLNNVSYRQSSHCSRLACLKNNTRLSFNDKCCNGIIKMWETFFPPRTSSAPC